MSIFSKMGFRKVPTPDWEAKFKAAAKDLEANSNTIATLRHNAELDRQAIQKQAARIAELNAEIAALTPDATFWRQARDKRTAAKRSA